MPGGPDRSLIGELAAAAAAIGSNPLAPMTLERVRLHALDSVGAMFAGLQTTEGEITRRAFGKLFPALPDATANPSYLAASMSACGRLTECDDIHVSSCTTPGAVVFAAALAAWTIEPESRAFAPAVVAGYQIMTGLGLAANGAQAIYQKIWPTYLGAAMTSAATSAIVMGLEEERLRHAIAIAATMTTGVAGRIARDPSSRWLTLGCAVQNGLAAAVAAQAGIIGDTSILESYRDELGLVSSNCSCAFETTAAVALCETELKPYCSGRQSLAATEAFSALLAEFRLEPALIERIEVRVPAQVRDMIDRSARPKTKLESRGVRYQLALAAFHPDELFDIERKRLRSAEPEMGRLMDRIDVVGDPRLTDLYPEIWGGAVSTDIGGKRYEREILFPKGGPQASMSIDEIVVKLQSISAFLPRSLPVAMLKKSTHDLNQQEIMGFIADWHRSLGPP